jgi:hypothetical protein
MLKIKGYVKCVLRNREGEIVQIEEGENSLTEMSNNILMDCLSPMVGTNATPFSAPDRGAIRPTTDSRQYTDDSVYPTGFDYMGPVGSSGLSNINQSNHINMIGWIAVGTNTGNTGQGGAHSNANQDVTEPTYQYTMVDSSFDPLQAGDDSANDAKYCRKIDSFDYTEAKKLKFTTTFGTGEGNIEISEIALWTAGQNIDANGFVANTNTASRNYPNSTTNMRMFARRVLANTISKTNDGTLEVSYTITFGT